MSRRKDVRGNSKPSGMSINSLLCNIGAAKKADGDFKPTNAGVLFFAEKPQRFIHQSRLRAARFSGRKVTRDFIDRNDYEGTIWRL